MNAEGPDIFCYLYIGLSSTLLLEHSLRHHEQGSIIGIIQVEELAEHRDDLHAKPTLKYESSACPRLEDI